MNSQTMRIVLVFSDFDNFTSYSSEILGGFSMSDVFLKMFMRRVPTLDRVLIWTICFHFIHCKWMTKHSRSRQHRRGLWTKTSSLHWRLHQRREKYSQIIYVCGDDPMFICIALILKTNSVIFRLNLAIVDSK